MNTAERINSSTEGQFGFESDNDRQNFAIPSNKPPHGDAPDAWKALSQTLNIRELCQCWLSLCAQQITDFNCGLIVLKGEGEEAFVPVAALPIGKLDLGVLAMSAQTALAQRSTVEMRATVKAMPGPGSLVVTHIAQPIEIQNTVYGAFAIGVASDNRHAIQLARQQMSWGAAWLTQFFWREGYQKLHLASERSSWLLDLLLVISEKDEFQEVLITLVNNLATQLKLKRASLGWVEKGEVRVKAISNTAHFQRSHEAVQVLSRAMEEACDQRHNILWPRQDEAKNESQPSRLITSDHEALLASDAVDAVASFLIQLPGQVLGVLTFEYDQQGRPSANDEIVGEALGSALAPLLLEKRQADRWLGGKYHTRLRKIKSALLGDEHPVYKLAAITGVLLAALVFGVQGEFRITAKTVIEGLMQRAMVAPFEGFIGQAPVRAGDRVKAGQLVASLDDKDLVLEKVRLDSEVTQNVRKYRDALAKHDRATASVVGAQLNQSEAQLGLVNEKLERASIRAPFDGIVVSGDLSQKLGAPVEQGSVLYEITPLDAYRIILKVDERDISYVQPGQSGQLTLTGLTGEILSFTVKTVTPVAVAEDGVNYFRVEAELAGEKPLLRPGMEGVGKISAGEDSLWRIWTRRFVDWLSISLWTWLP